MVGELDLVSPHTGSLEAVTDHNHEVFFVKWEKRKIPYHFKWSEQVQCIFPFRVALSHERVEAAQSKYINIDWSDT